MLAFLDLSCMSSLTFFDCVEVETGKPATVTCANHADFYLALLVEFTSKPEVN